MAVTIPKQIVLILLVITLLQDACGKDENPDIDKLDENDLYATIFQDPTSTTSSTPSSTDNTIKSTDPTSTTSSTTSTTDSTTSSSTTSSTTSSADSTTSSPTTVSTTSSTDSTTSSTGLSTTSSTTSSTDSTTSPTELSTASSTTSSTDFTTSSPTTSSTISSTDSTTSSTELPTTSSTTSSTDSTTSSPTTSSTTSSTDSTTSSTISTKPPPQQLMCKRQNDSTLGLWPPTPAGAWATPVNKICLHKNYTPVRRHCSENATWEKPDAPTCAQVELNNVTKGLDDLLLNNTDSPKAINTLVNLTATDQETFTPFDVYLLSEILNKASGNEDIANNPSNFTKVVSNVMNLEKQTMTYSQQLINTTDVILDSLDKLLLKTKRLNVTEPKLLIRTINVTNNVLGAMIRSTNTSFNYFEITELTDDKPLQNENFEVAFLVPPSFARDHYYITLFYNDYLFNQEQSATVGSWILSILIPESTNDGNSTIQIYFKEFGKHAQQLCHHWKYGKDENLVAISGKWQYDSVGKKFKEEFYICEVNHTTHFGMLVSDTVPDNFILDLITIFGSIMSIVGIIVIILTGVIFKKWRNEISRKIIINVSVCLLLLIILFFISDRVNNGPICIVVGILLHYMVIAQFCWSLVVSYTSYRRYYMVFNNITHILKYCIFSWGAPLIIVTITSAINFETYDKKQDENSSEICYPKEIFLKLGVCLPMGIILTINLIIYILIIKNLAVTKLNIRKHATKKSYTKHKVLILLFFMMGISWVFGFLVAFTDNMVILYIFCTTATFHGFVIFIFYIVDSTQVLEQWKRMFHKIVPKRSTQRLSPKSSNTAIVSESAVG